jgi:hypothetical protein
MCVTGSHDMKKALPIGISDFKKIISEDYYFIDKSLFIKELLEYRSSVTLIPRPRRFGKTINLSMLQYFFEKPVPNPMEETKNSNRALFNNLKISQYPDVMEHQGKYPVIFITFKDIKQSSWRDCYDKIKQIIGNEFRRHNYLLDSKILDEAQKQKFQAIIDCTASNASYENSLKDLSEYLAKYHNQKPIILIDEYDSPVHAAFIQNYYDSTISFFRGFLCGCLKDNSYLQFSVITGILRIAKESIFSGLNNLNVCTLLSPEYSDKFGLTESEVKKILEYYKITESVETVDKVKKWYDGYATLKVANLYNPWSIINFVAKDNIFSDYWINTSSNDIVKDLVQAGGASLKIEFEKLLSSQTTTQEINETIVFQSLKSNTNTVWNFLLATGYLTFRRTWLDETRLKAELAIPNLEVKHFYETTILNWFLHESEGSDYTQMLARLTSGDVSEFKKIFKNLVLNCLSYFDASGKMQEKFYHALVLGMLVSLGKTHQIKSNRESGYGRYDIMLIPIDINKYGIVIEFKKVDPEDETLETAADKALKQIEDKNYTAELESLGIKKILKLGIAFEGKKVLIKDCR